jgi:hypothetical protein
MSAKSAISAKSPILSSADQFFAEKKSEKSEKKREKREKSCFTFPNAGCG